MIHHLNPIATDRVVEPRSRTWPLRALAALAFHLFDGMGAKLRHRRDCRRLAELPDYLLDDVGLTRADISAASRRLF